MRSTKASRRLGRAIGGPVMMLLPFLLLETVCAHESAAGVTLNRKDDGYRGIWYYNQRLDSPYVYKYSGGFGTYCAKHQPFAVYCAEVGKTFFCYGGTTKNSYRRLQHLVSVYDHRSGMVPRPTILLDKHTDDAHDNPVISVDNEGYIWIFSTSHGRARPSYIHRSRRPHEVDAFDLVPATYQRDGSPTPLTNFSYMQAWHVPEEGFLCFFTRYADPAERTSMFMRSADGRRWSRWQRLAAIDQGHYQISVAASGKAAVAMNFHPAGKGLNWRTNLYYLETRDGGDTWQTASGTRVQPPLATIANPALVHDYQAEGLNVYLKDICLDGDGQPAVLFLTSRGYESGPANDPRTWVIAHWGGSRWDFRPVSTSDSNYDMGSLYIDGTTWRIIAPTQPGPQRYNPGGEMVLWESRDTGRTWQTARQLTNGSPWNHSYARRPVNAHPDFYAIWADGHGREPSPSRIYFCDRAGNVFQLPTEMGADYERPLRVGSP